MKFHGKEFVAGKHAAATTWSFLPRSRKCFTIVRGLKILERVVYCMY